MVKTNIFLIGPMGAGKSSVGKYLAELLNMDFYDTDEELEKRTGATIGWIFDLEGEEGFREREEKVVSELVTLTNIVLATGGGTILSPLCRKLLRDNGTIVHLHVSLDFQKNRTVNESRRPLLRGNNKLKILTKLYKERQHYYETLADFTVLTDERSINAVTSDIIHYLEKDK